MAGSSAPVERPLRVLVTGATGFVGLQTALELHGAGHRVRLLVRSPEKARRVLPPALHEVEQVQGDMLDADAVGRALVGCDAVVHAAALVNLRATERERVVQANRRAAELVIGGAVQRGIARIVQVSSASALVAPGLGVVDEDTPLATRQLSYGRSKIEADRYVRGLQAGGAPIQTTYPGTVLGPGDPGLSEGMAGLRVILNLCGLLTTSGIQILDVRDLALAHRRLIERGGPPARYVLGGQYLPWARFGALLDEVVGSRVRRLRLPAPLLVGLGWLADLIYPVFHHNWPISREAVYYAAGWTPTDDRRARRALQLKYRDLRQTLGDAILWLDERGLLRRRDYAAHIRQRRLPPG